MLDRIDWVEEFIKKFSVHGIIATLKGIKFHGKLEINFADGVHNTCHINWCVKPYSKNMEKTSDKTE